MRCPKLKVTPHPPLSRSPFSRRRRPHWGRLGLCPKGLSQATGTAGGHDLVISFINPLCLACFVLLDYTTLFPTPKAQKPASPHQKSGKVWRNRCRCSAIIYMKVAEGGSVFSRKKLTGYPVKHGVNSIFNVPYQHCSADRDFPTFSILSHLTA